MKTADQDKISLAVDTCSTSLGVQLSLCGPTLTPATLIQDYWALGYVFGFHDGMMQRLGIQQDTDVFAVLSASYVVLFLQPNDDPDLAAALLSRTLALQEDPIFQEGAAAGGGDVFAFVSTKTTPLGLSDHFLGKGRSEPTATAPESAGAHRNQRIPNSSGPPRIARGLLADSASHIVSDRGNLWPAIMLVTIIGTVALVFFAVTANHPSGDKVAPANAREGPTEASVPVERAEIAATALPPARELSEEQNYAMREEPRPTPSFDCGRAFVAAEALVCGDEEIAGLDRELSAAYASFLPLAASTDAVRADQLSWLQNIRNRCSDVDCLKTVYAERIAMFRRAASTPVAPPMR